MSVICQGCGLAFEVPEGYSRNKIQCPSCGVICAVPAGAARAGPAPRPRKRESAPEDEAAKWLCDPDPAFEPPAVELPDLPPPAVVSSPPRPAPEMLVSCRRCGRKIKRQRECPVCDVGVDEPLSPEPIRPVSLELDEPETLMPVDEEDASPYVLADKLMPTCPKCKKDLATETAVVCTACGFNLKTRKKATKTFEPIARAWETNLPLPTRLAWFGGVVGVHFFLLGLVALGGGNVWAFLTSLPLLALTMAFILGTFDRIELTRDTRGRVRIIKKWRFCFVPVAPRVTEVYGFEGIVTGQYCDAGFWEWFIFVWLFPVGIVGAIIWWYLVIHTPNFHVALAKDHGRADVFVYRGQKLEQMREIAEAICAATGLRDVS